MQSVSPSQPPAPPGEENQARWRYSGLRRRLQDGTWKRDLERRVLTHLGHVRTAGIGPVDLSANAARVTAHELATLYLTPPAVKHDDGDVMLALERGPVHESGLWAQARRYQRWVIGCREYALRVTADERGRLRYRPVPPDRIIATADPSTPDVPASIAEARLRVHPSGRDVVWTWDRYDVSDPDAPIYEIREATGKADPFGANWTEHYLGASMSGPAYPYRHRVDEPGLPRLPYIIHHAERVGDRLFDAFEGMELIEGALNMGVLMSFWLHVVKDASWPQRWAVGARPAGLTTVDSDGQERRQEIVTDPAVLLVLEQIIEGLQPQIGQFDPGGDPEALLRAIEAYGAKIAQDAGISPSDMQRMSADPRSGYAISLSNEGKREAQRRFTESFRYSDERLMNLSAVMLNSATGSTEPESGYSVIYHEIPLSPDERQSREESALRRLEAGLLSRIDAYRELNPGLTREQAARDLEAIGGADTVADGDDAELQAPASTEGGDVQKTALNGAQVTSMVETVSAVAEGRLPANAATLILQRAFQLSASEANAMIASARTFTPAKQENDTDG